MLSMENILKYPGHSPDAADLTQLFLDSFRFHGALIAAGDRLSKQVGLTAARWQVLSTVARAEQPETVANIGRIMGLTRQSVQRIVNEQTSEGLLRLESNPSHKRASLVCLTDAGRKSFEAITALQIQWANAVAQQLKGHDIGGARKLITALSQLLESRVGEP